MSNWSRRPEGSMTSTREQTLKELPMIQTYTHQEEILETRLDLRTIEDMFTNLITEGTNCSPFESEEIVEKAKEVFAIRDHTEGNIL
jgi:hypothetical protein